MGTISRLFVTIINSDKNAYLNKVVIEAKTLNSTFLIKKLKARFYNYIVRVMYIIMVACTAHDVKNVYKYN